MLECYTRPARGVVSVNHEQMSTVLRLRKCSKNAGESGRVSWEFMSRELKIYFQHPPPAIALVRIWLMRIRFPLSGLDLNSVWYEFCFRATTTLSL